MAIKIASIPFIIPLLCVTALEILFSAISTAVINLLANNLESVISLLSKSFILQETNLYTAHECLHLPYEESLTRFDSQSFRPFSCSSHFLWIGERTRHYNEAHIEFIRGIHNPIGLKVSSQYEKEELLKTIQKVNPYNFMGRVTLMTRFGADKINELSNLIQLIQEHRLNVVWICDPMHGNTKEKDGFKVRYIEDIQYEIQQFFRYLKMFPILISLDYHKLTGKALDIV